MKLSVNKLKDFAKWLKSYKGITGKSLFKEIRSLEIKNFYINANWSLFNRKISLQVKGSKCQLKIDPLR